MGWTDVQRSRLALEKDILERFFGAQNITWIDPHSNTKIDIRMTSNSNQVYTLRLYVPGDMPNSMPDLVVCNWPRSRPDWGSSGTTHTLGQRDGFLKICHYYAPRWNQQCTFYEVFVKGRVWLEAYEGCMAAGNNRMDNFLGHMN